MLTDIETYERTSLPSDAYRLALDYQNLTLSPIETRRQLAGRVDCHYRNRNLRIAVTEELINKLIPEREPERAEVDETVLGYPVRGESIMSTEVAVRMLPDPARVRIALEVKGAISAATTADAGPAQFHSHSQSYYVARKPLEIDMNGVSVWPVEVGVDNQTQLRGVSTPLDGIPLLGAVARGVAKSQSEQSRSAAAEEVKQKIADQARERIDAEARTRLTEFVARMNQRVFDPLNSLSLDPQMISGETTEKRFTMQLRLAGEDQLGGHTPRPEAPADSLASVQVHESAINNAIGRLQLNGRTFTLPELSKHVAARLNRPAPWEINPDYADVKITFAEKDAVIGALPGRATHFDAVDRPTQQIAAQVEELPDSGVLPAEGRGAIGRAGARGGQVPLSRRPAAEHVQPHGADGHFCQGPLEEQQVGLGARSDRQGAEAGRDGDHTVHDRRRLDRRFVGSQAAGRGDGARSLAMGICGRVLGPGCSLDFESISNFSVPCGTTISTRSPIFLPTRPWASGLVMRILPVRNPPRRRQPR